MTSNRNTSSADNQAVGLPTHQDAADLTVFYDGACPLCSREINFYQKRSGLADVDWVDVSDCDDSDMPAGLTREQALARFHISLPDGSLQSGPRGFGEIWLRMRGVSWLGKVAQINRLQPVYELLYSGFLRLRSILIARMRRH